MRHNVHMKTISIRELHRHMLQAAKHFHVTGVNVLSESS